MNQKIEITKKVLEIIKPDYDHELFQRALTLWWTNNRKKNNGGLRLTDVGFGCFQQADVKMFKVQFEKIEHSLTNKMVIWLDNYIDCPFYITQNEIYVSSEKMAVQLVLFGGDVKHFVSVKAKNNNRS